jgi:hypothetical protein
MICGVNGCNHHHDPFFHDGQVEQVVRVEEEQDGEEGLDSWSRVAGRHHSWNNQKEITYQERQINSHHERMRIVEMLTDQRAVEIRYGNLRDGRPPNTFRRNRAGEVVMSERMFNMLSNSFGHDAHLARHLAIGAVRRVFLEMNQQDRQAALRDELALAQNRDNPRRLERLVKTPDESDEGFVLRVAKRALALELIPPSKIRRENPDDTSDDEPEAAVEQEAPESGPGEEQAEAQPDAAEAETEEDSPEEREPSETSESNSSDLYEYESDEGEGGDPPPSPPFRFRLSGTPF